MPLKTFYMKVRFKYLPKALSIVLRPAVRDDLELVGSVYGRKWVPTSLLNAKSIVYCVGCGEDISFDLGLIKRFGCDVYGFDPTPRAIKHVETHGQNPKYHFTPVGLWTEDTKLKFYLNDNPMWVSGSIVGLTGTTNSIEVDVRTLKTIMRDNGHAHLDLLKIDVEGVEYDIFNDLIEHRIFPACITVDFDQPTPLKKTRAMIQTLDQHGYDLVKIQAWDFLFVRREAELS